MPDDCGREGSMMGGGKGCLKVCLRTTLQQIMCKALKKSVLLNARFTLEFTVLETIEIIGGNKLVYWD